MALTFIFCCFCSLQLKMRSCGHPFPKSIVYNDVVLKKLGQSYCLSFKSNSLKVAEKFPLESLEVFKTFNLLWNMQKRNWKLQDTFPGKTWKSKSVIERIIIGITINCLFCMAIYCAYYDLHAKSTRVWFSHTKILYNLFYWDKAVRRRSFICFRVK